MRNAIAIVSIIFVLSGCGGSSQDEPAPFPPAPATLSEPTLEATAATFAGAASAPTGDEPALPNLVPTRLSTVKSDNRRSCRFV